MKRNVKTGEPAERLRHVTQQLHFSMQLVSRLLTKRQKQAAAELGEALKAP